MTFVKLLLKSVATLLLIAIVGLAITISYDTDCPAPQDSVSNGITAVSYHCYGGPEVLVLQQVKKPVPADTEVLVKVHSAGVNPLDWHYMRGSPYFMRLSSGLGAPNDSRFGVDFAGTVESVGSKVTRFKPGDAVFGGQTGAFGQYISVSHTGAIAHKPENVSFDQAGGVAIAAVTALQALRDEGQLKAGHKVLINGASGGVGTFAVQIAKAMGAQVTGVSSPRNHERVRDLGADHMIDYKTENYTRGSERYDLILDMIGNHSPLANASVLTPKGKLLMVGGGKGDWVGPVIGPLKALLQSPLIDQEMILIMAVLSGESMEALAEMMRSEQLVTSIDRSYALEDIRDAIAYSESGRARGKIVISGINSNEIPLGND